MPVGQENVSMLMSSWKNSIIQYDMKNQYKSSI